MNILLFGATGMVGDGVLRWLIASPKVSRVVADASTNRGYHAVINRVLMDARASRH